MRLCSQALLTARWGGPYIPEGEVDFVPARAPEELTHAKCPLGVQLKALGTANSIFFCNAKRKTQREPIPQDILGLHFGLVQAVDPAGSSAPALNQTCDSGTASWLLAQACWRW